MMESTSTRKMSENFFKLHGGILLERVVFILATLQPEVSHLQTLSLIPDDAGKLLLFENGQ
jgi:hypothetical protein